MRGRDRELRIAEEFLRATEQGQGGVLLIEGEPGAGKSSFLGEMIDMAALRNFSLAAAEADELGRRTPFAVLLAALQEPVDGITGEAFRPGPDAWLAAVIQIRALLERRAATSPMLVILDDLQHADPATLFALRLLIRHLAARPLGWILARSTGGPRDSTAVLFDLIGRGRAVRVALDPLDGEAVAGLITDIIGAQPDPGLLTLASGAAGNPLLVTELIRGLHEENAVLVSQGTASVVSSQLPQRVVAAAERRLGHLGQDARHLLETAAVLGAEFWLDDLAEILSRAPTAIIPVVNESLEARILRAGTDTFAFRHHLIWQAVTQATPPPTRHVLHRRFGGILLARGGSARRAAAHLLEGAREPDPGITASLDIAAAQLVRSDPHTAADLALRALDLTPATDPSKVPRTVRAADALAAAARLDEASAVVRAGLAQPQPVANDTQLRYVLSSILVLQGQVEEASAEAETVLRRHLTIELRDKALITKLQALTALGENVKALSLAEGIRATSSQHGEPALAAALTVLASTDWNRGRLERGLHLVRQAVRRIGGVTPDARHFQPLLTFAAMLIDVRRLGDAEDAIRAASEGIQAFRPSVFETIPPILRARVSLARGKADEAHAEAEKALTIADMFGVRPHSSLVRSVLSVIALRKGDLRTAGLHIRNRPDARHHTGAYACAESLLARAQFVEATVGAETAMQVLGSIYADLPAHRHVLIGEPTASAWLARTALAAGHHELAADVARIADELARDNPAFDVVTVAAAHCGGIVRQDPARLADAAARHPDPWARASAAEDLSTVLIEMNHHDGAVAQLDDALAGYGGVGADRDLARVRRRLRKLGVRRQHRLPAGRPGSGWASLTETELVTVTMVAEGLTNQQVAQRMYVSAHTVAFHLKQVFRKLGISSRVELARLVAEQMPAQWHGQQRGMERERG